MGKEGVELALELQSRYYFNGFSDERNGWHRSNKGIIEQWPEAKIIIVTSFLDDEKVYPALEAGATSYMLKTSKASEIANAVRATYLMVNTYSWNLK